MPDMFYLIIKIVLKEECESPQSMAGDRFVCIKIEWSFLLDL